MRIAIRALVVGASVLALVGCGSEPGASGANTTVNESVPTVANDVTSRVIGDASTFSLNAVVTQKPVAFWFWAPG
jgi:ABC-type glycerol-3-phosphate transport system substrate-binding protein